MNLLQIALVGEYLILLASASGPESQFWSFPVHSGIRNSILNSFPIFFSFFFLFLFFFIFVLFFFLTAHIICTTPFSIQMNFSEVIPSTNFLELRYSKMNLSCMMLFCSVSSIFQWQIPAQKGTLIQFGFYTRSLIYITLPAVFPYEYNVCTSMRTGCHVKMKLLR